MSGNPRESAITALCKIDDGGAYSNRALMQEFKALEPRDRAFANELVMGVLQNRLYLDFVIQSYSKIKLKKLSKWVLQILRTGVYQLVKMDKIPPSASCNESVKLAARYANKGAKGYVNGVLRTVARSLDSLPQPTGSTAEIMSVKYSCPLWLTERLAEQFGEDVCEEILQDSLRPRGAMIRANTLKAAPEELAELLAKEGITAGQDADVPQCLRIKGAIDVNCSDLYKQGYYSLQNINSVRTALTLDPQKGETVIDVCSAPGGKTCHIAELMGNEGRVIAMDIHPHKIKLIEKTAERLGLTCVEAMVNDSRNAVEELAGKADRVLADVPCSGIGVIHKKPDIKYNRSAEDTESLCAVQKRILSSSAKYVKSGGVLVYSTCTILREENQEQTEAFLRENADFEKVSEELYLAHKTGGSGFYICKMRRKV